MSITEEKPQNRVVTLLKAGFGGGVNSIVGDLADEVTRQFGREFFALTVHENGGGPSHAAVDLSYDGDEQISRTVRSLVSRTGHVPIFVVNGIGIDFALGNHLRRNGTRIVYILHADSDYYYSTALRFRPIVDVYVAISTAIAVRLKEILGTDASIVTIYNSVRVPAAILGEGPSDVIRLVYIGRVDDDQKRCSRAKEVIGELVRREIPFHLTVIGDGPYLAKFRADVSEVGGENRGSFLGVLPRDEAMGHLAQQDILLLFSGWEGMCMAMLEAMARGVVPVVTRTSGATDVIEEGGNGFMVAQDSLMEMVERISLLRSEPYRWREMSRAARQTILDRFSMERAAGEYENIFKYLDGLGPWKGAVPNLVLRRDMFDMPLVSDVVAKRLRKFRRFIGV